MVQKTKAELQRENEAFEKRIRELEATAKEELGKAGAAMTDDPSMATYMKEIQDIAKKGRVDTNKLLVVETTDHKNISLWTKWGKRIGPLHPHNAERTFKLFWLLGNKLSATQPTPEQIKAYLASDENKEREKKFAESRAIKDKSRRKGAMEKYTAEIARLTGVTVEAINHVFKAKDIKPLSAGDRGPQENAG